MNALSYILYKSTLTIQNRPEGVKSPTAVRPVIGTVKGAQAFLSIDGTAIYSEFTITTMDILLSSREMPVGVRNCGGAVWRECSFRFWEKRGHYGRPLLRKDKSYLFILRWDGQSEDYVILTAYQIDSRTVAPLDGQPADPFFREYNMYTDISTEEFLKRVGKAVTNVSRAGD